MDVVNIFLFWIGKLSIRCTIFIGNRRLCFSGKRHLTRNRRINDCIVSALRCRRLFICSRAFRHLWTIAILINRLRTPWSTEAECCRFISHNSFFLRRRRACFHPIDLYHNCRIHFLNIINKILACKDHKQEAKVHLYSIRRSILLKEKADSRLLRLIPSLQLQAMNLHVPILGTLNINEEDLATNIHCYR